jgi:glycosyltransferase involved in cell wall biosynthesis
MRILYISSESPFPALGHVTMRTQAFFTAWLAKGVDVTLACFPQTPVGPESVPERYKKSIWQIVPKRTLTDKISDWETTHHFKRTSRQAMLELGSLVSKSPKFDVVVVEELAMARPLLWLKKNYTDKFSKFVYIAHNHERDLYEQVVKPADWLGKRRLSWLENFEKSALESSDATFAFSDTLREQLSKYKSKSKLLSTSVCFDFSKIRHQQDRSRCRHLSIVGALNYQPNIDSIEWFANEIYPKIKTRPPVLIAGSHPSEALKKLCKKNDFELIDTPQDMGDVLDRTRVEIVPLRLGSGVRGKIIEALGSGIPVVSTTLGVEGLAVKRDIHVLIGDTSDAIAQQTDRLFRDPALYAGLAREGRTFAQRYDCKSVAEKLAERLQQL